MAGGEDGVGRHLEDASRESPSETVSTAQLRALMDEAVQAALPSFGNMVDQKIREVMQSQGERGWLCMRGWLWILVGGAGYPACGTEPATRARSCACAGG